MNLQMEELFSVLTHECFFAADRFKEVLGVQCEHDYDVVFKHMSSALQPIVMWDGLIPENARQQIVRGVVERSDLNDDMHTEVNTEFLKYVRKNASENMAPFLNVLVAHYGGINYSGKKFEYPSERFPSSLFYGEWMEDYALKEDLQKLRTIHNRIEISKSDSKNSSREDRIASVVSQLKNPSERQVFMDFVGRYSQHPKFSYILDNLGESKHEMYLFHHSRFPKFENVLLDNTKSKLSELVKEMHMHWNDFSSQRTNILAELLATSIQNRCIGMLKHMENDLHTDISVAVAPLDKSNVEEFRSKQSTCAAPLSSHTP